MQRKTTLLLALLGIIIISLTIESLNSQNKQSLSDPFFITTDQTEIDGLTINNTLENYVETEDDIMKSLSTSLIYSDFNPPIISHIYLFSKYWGMRDIGTANILYSSTDFLNWSIERNIANSKLFPFQIGTTLYLGVYLTATNKWRIDSTINGSTWTTGTEYSLPATPYSSDFLTILNIFQISSTIWIQFHINSNFNDYRYKCYFVKSDNSGTVSHTDQGNYNKGSIVDSIYYYICSESVSTSKHHEMWSFNGSAITKYLDTCFPDASTLMEYPSNLFYKNGSWLCLLKNEYTTTISVYAMTKGTSIFRAMGSESVYGIGSCSVLNQDQSLAYFVVNGNFYKWIGSSFAIAINSSIVNNAFNREVIYPYIYVFTDEPLAKIYQITISSISSITNAKYLYPLQASPSAQIQSNVQYTNNQYLVLYSDLDVEEFEGYVDLTNGLSIDPIMEYKLVSLAEQDLTRDIYITESSATAGTIITNAINNNCLGITVGTISTSTPSTVYTFSNYKTTLKLLLDLFNYNHGYRWQLAPNLALSWNNGTVDTGIDCVAPTDAMTVPTRTLLTLSKGRIEVIGMGTNGTILTGVYQASTSFGVFRYYRLDLKTQTEVDTMALALGTTQNQNPYQYTFTVFGKALIQVGNQITFGGTDSAFTLASAQAYVTNVEYDAISQEQRVVVVDLFYQEKPKDNGLTNDTLLTEVSATTVRVNTLETTTVPTTRTISTTAPLSGGGDLSANRTLTFDPTAVPYLKQDASNDYKNLYAEQWGTSGIPSGWSYSPNPVTSDQYVDITTISGFGTNVARLFKTVYGQTQLYKSYTAMATGFVSFRIRTTAVSGNSITIQLRNSTTDRIAIRIDSGYWQIHNSTAYANYIPAAANTNYHICIYYSGSSTIYYFINGVLIASNKYVSAFTDTDSIMVQINGVGTDDHYCYFDAFYAGTEYLKAWSSMYAGMVASPQFFTEYGERGIHMLLSDHSGWVAGGSNKTAGTGGYLILNPTTMAYTNSALTLSTTPSTANILVPPNAKDVYFTLRGAPSAANSSNTIAIRTEGSQYFITPLYTFPNYEQLIMGLVPLSDSKQVRITVGVGASITIWWYVAIRGYTI